MSNEVARREDVVDPFVEIVERLSAIPNLNAETIDKVLAMNERVLDRNAETEFAAAMARVQEKLPTVLKDAYNEQTSSRYAKHERIARVIKPIYTKEGFSITFSEADSPKEKHIRIVGILRHRAGYKESHWIDVAIDDSGIKGSVNKTLTHAEGSSQTYGRRRLTCLLFDVATGDDDDGNGASGTGLVTEEQVETLQKLLDNVSDEDNDLFFKWAKVEALADLPAKKYATCEKKLREKQRAAD